MSGRNIDKNRKEADDQTEAAYFPDIRGQPSFPVRIR
jgi:hypothetical protein